MKVSPGEQAQHAAFGIEHLETAEIRVHDRDGRVENLMVQPVSILVLDEQAADLLQRSAAPQFARQS
jgi:hypothetical protein